MSNFLIAFSFLSFILSSLGGIQTLLEELQCLLEIVLFLLLQGDGLVDADKFLTDFLLELGRVALLSLAQGRYQI